MEEENTNKTAEASDAPPSSNADEVNNHEEQTNECKVKDNSDNSIATIKEESDIIVKTFEDCKSESVDFKESFVENGSCEAIDDARSIGDLDSLPAGDELALGAAGSDSGVEGCGRALSSGGGSRSCASSVVSCGSGCGSESSSLAGAPPRPRRRVNVTVAEPKRSSPVGTSTPRPVTAPRGPNLATRERARSREKPTPPEKPRPLTPKPRIRPTTDLPNLVRESPALRAKPTKTSTARCRTPNSPVDEKKWPTNGQRLSTATDATATRVAADKYGTLPRRRRDVDPESSPKHESTPPTSRRPTVSRSVSSRTATKTRVRIYAEKICQTVLVGTDIESALAGIVPNIESRIDVTRCHRGVQASARDTEIARLVSAAAVAEAVATEERERRLHVEAQLAAERAARLAAISELERNSQRLLELAGAGAGANADGCLRALEEQLRSARELATRQRGEIDALRDHCDKLHAEACNARETSRVLEARLSEAEREAAEMQDFLAAETGALSDSLRDAEAEITRLTAELERRRGECRQLVRMCEQRRQEALAAGARARGGAGAAAALDTLSRRLRALTEAVRAAYALPPHAIHPTVYHNEAYCSRSDSGETLSPEEDTRGGLLGAVARALRSAAAAAPLAHNAHNAHYAHNDDERSRVSDDNDNSADLLDSETEPCLVTDPECAEEWWSGAEGAGAWSGEELSPERESCGDGDKEAEGEGSAESQSMSERDSLRNLSAAIAARQRWEAEGEEAARGALLERVLALDLRLADLLRALAAAAQAANSPSSRAPDTPTAALAHALRDKIEVTEKNVADVVVKKLAELDACKNLMEQYQHSIEVLKSQLAQRGEEDEIELIEQELECCDEGERRRRCEAVEAALGALSHAPRLLPLRRRLERLALALAAPPPAPAPRPPVAQPAACT
ncbi:uncharacterized protein LOC123880936 [Maniola jurtina]|uniref:uncharacterized protein LOC123880936 n=1 Tax=Maniola jurtina TaxID=191418 RepID=UPI001E68B624|nr:uncharacterized protein LOC123880936 [Maniola jurtina]XP_045785323.1 uncharacterized protein LOC123880936 [Maniola jurtina]XP_045785324.1 uncharacterized protein LOC123880936 [Maniola jurtina]XP_045785325.1 uncharacterized protein LOC123880936 [Maniola jurtina]XP_045785326.1 uncharacterized protein LOC123880936 [Maniola jurtina]